MSEHSFISSDSQRHARPLKHAQSVTFEQPLTLEHGGRLSCVTVVYETYGQLNAARDNAVLICHALSGDSHVAAHDPEDDAGWWDIVVGSGKAIDTDRYLVICPNLLGGCRGTTGPNSIDPASGRPYGGDFPLVTIGDMVRVQARLIDHLGIDRLLAVVGGSLGGHQTLEWAVRYPQRVRGALAIATSPRLTSQALAYDVIGRNAILCDPSYHGGQYYHQHERPTVGLAIARMLGHLTYLSREAMIEKFDTNRMATRDISSRFETRFSVGSYLAHQGDKFVERFDANSYLTLSMAMDLFNLSEKEPLEQVLARSLCRWLVVSFSSDLLFPPFQSEELVQALVAAHKPVSYCGIASRCGHDAFLLHDNLDRYGHAIAGFLANLDDHAPGPTTDRTPPAPAPFALPILDHGPTSIFHARRLDYDTILDLIPPRDGPGPSVLDVGCGTGGLLWRLRQRGHGRLIGVEIDERAILACIDRGLDVVQADLNQGLAAFADGEFDFVVLSQTLQAVKNVEAAVRDMLRVGRRCIVSFPNLAYHKLRRILAEDGRAPRASALQGMRWHDTPNIRFLSIADFEDFCREGGIRIHRQVALDTEAGRRVTDDPNRNADVAVFVVSR